MSNTEITTLAAVQTSTVISLPDSPEGRLNPRKMRRASKRAPNGRNKSLHPWMVGLLPGGYFALLLSSRHCYGVMCWLSMRAVLSLTNPGLTLTFGVFQDYYSKIPEFADSRYISVVGTIATGFGYLGAPVILPLIQRYQRWQRQLIWVGCKYHDCDHIYS
jgi:hypothetical protein